MNRRVCVVGLGYIGLPTAAVLANSGYEVAGYDVNTAVVEALNQGKVIITEPDLDGFVLRATKSGNLKAYNCPQLADIYIIAVPTPFMGDKKPDLSFVLNAVDKIAGLLSEGSLVVLESTSPVGTTESIANKIFASRPELKGAIAVAYCPERVLPGKILRELVENDRIVGGIDAYSTLAASRFYSTFVLGAVLQTDARTAEMCKLTENAYRDVNIAFANELSVICDELDIEVRQLIKLANHHPRVNILSPGPGVGGHCIAVDPWFIVDRSPGSARLIKTARTINDSKPEYVAEKVLRLCIDCEKPVVVCLGLSFKADVDDYRESPSVEVVRLLAERADGVRLIATDPFTSELPRELRCYDNVEFTPDYTEALKCATHIVVLTDHGVYRKIERAQYVDKVIVDTRGLFENIPA